MNPQVACYNEESLQKLMQSDEDSADIRRFEQHVAECSSCQARLEQLAADPDEWRKAKDSLSPAKDDGDQSRDAEDCPAASRRWTRRPTAWTDSMAKQLLSPPSHPEMLGRIGRYEVERLIGAGGMGVVFKAFDTELNRPVAVKVSR